MQMIRVLLAEDHETVREGIRLLVNSQHDMRVIGEAPDGRSAIEHARALKPTAIVMDLNMPMMNGLAATRVLRAEVPASAVIVLTRHNDKAYLQEMLDAGADAYVLKQSASTALLSAIREAVAGRQYIDPALRDAVNLPLGSGRPPGSITDREREVLRRMALGHSNKEIAAALDISVKTVEVHKANAMRKLALGGRTDVVRYAALHGWLQDP